MEAAGDSREGSGELVLVTDQEPGQDDGSRLAKGRDDSRRAGGDGEEGDARGGGREPCEHEEHGQMDCGRDEEEAAGAVPVPERPAEQREQDSRHDGERADDRHRCGAVARRGPDEREGEHGVTGGGHG